MVGLGLSKKNDVYVWYANNRMTAGTSVDLDKKIKLRSYSPLLSEFRDGNAYTKITIQHLLDHKSGFRGSGDVSGAAAMYGVQAKNLDYEDVHAHFLRRGPLQSPPGATYSYSNHGFGMTTLLIEAITDRSYTDVAQNSYLKWVGVRGKVVPRSKNQTGLDTDLFDVTENGVKKRQPSNSGLGLAAGGWLSSAENLLRITNKLNKAYSVDEIDKMGWKSSGTSNRKLSHSGATGGGEAYVVMFTQGYTSHAGLDLSNIHVAVATNTGNVSGAALKKLADQVAKAVPTTGVPVSYTAW
jgi:CubicO group peptidase (beta-lactamase class C family)